MMRFRGRKSIVIYIYILFIWISGIEKYVII